MKESLKEKIRLEARVDRLQEARRGLFRIWFALDGLRGLDGLADPVEAAYDEVAQAWRVAVEEAGDEVPEDRFPDGIDEAIEVGSE